MSLSDKIRKDIVVAQNTGGLIKADNVKEAVNELKKKLPLHKKSGWGTKVITYYELDKLLLRVFGKELCEDGK